MSTTNQPTSGAFAAAVWTGHEMVVWGGVRPFITTTYLGGGGRYNPATDSWIQMSTNNEPSARSGHTAVWTGTDYIMFGGTNGVTNLNTGARYTVATDTWTPLSLSKAPTPRSLHTAVWTGDQMIIFGGVSPNGSYTYANSGGRYDPETDTWTSMPYLSLLNVPPTANHCALWTGQAMLIWGGYGDTGYQDTPFLYTPPRNMDLLLRP
jgi:N-acetylneuraminic acid mutarotase